MRRTSLLISPLSLIATFAVSCSSSEERVISANEGAARASIRTLGSGQMLYRSKKGEFATLKQLGDNDIIDARLASGMKSGYRFETKPGQRRICSSPSLDLQLNQASLVGSTSLWMKLVMRCTTSPPATAHSPECK
jgi:hypothetical protein